MTLPAVAIQDELPFYRSDYGSAPELRPYQSRAVGEILACVQRGRHPLYACATGSGKSVVLAAVVREVVAAGYEAWLVAHRRSLIHQLSEHVSAVGLEHGMIVAGERLTSHPVQVCSVDTVRARIEQLRERMERVGLLVCDESHHCTSATYSLMIEGCSNAVRLGCTATPYRLDGSSLGGIFNEPVRGPSPAELEAMGYISPVRIFAPPSKVDLSRVRKRMGDFVVSQLEKAVNTDEVTQAAILAYAKYAAGIPTIAYCTTVKHAEDCATAFAKLGWSVEVIEGRMDRRDQQQAIHGLAAARHDILFSVDCVSEGTDVPVVGAALMLRPTASTGLNLQQIGRTRRIAPGKTHSTIIDMVGNWSRHGMPNADRPWSLSEGVKGIERAVAAVRRCGICNYVCERGPERCPNCNRKYRGHVQKPGAPSEAVLSAMSGFAGLSALRISTMALKDILPLAKTRSDLETIAAIKQYARGWVDHVMRERALRGWQQQGRWR